jgi:hypothetical protein
VETTFAGRRRDTPPAGEFPHDAQRGDYWRLAADHPLSEKARESPTNLTGGAWRFYLGEELGYGLLVHHTVREHEDGTISVRPNDGSSNSILQHGSQTHSWHGYIERGVWTGEETRA